MEADIIRDSGTPRGSKTIVEVKKKSQNDQGQKAKRTASEESTDKTKKKAKKESKEPRPPGSSTDAQPAMVMKKPMQAAVEHDKEKTNKQKTNTERLRGCKKTKQEKLLEAASALMSPSSTEEMFSDAEDGLLPWQVDSDNGSLQPRDNGEVLWEPAD